MEWVFEKEQVGGALKEDGTSRKKKDCSEKREPNPLAQVENS